MKTLTLKKFLFMATACLLLSVGMGAVAFAQVRGGGRGAGVGGNPSGGSRPAGGVIAPQRGIIVAPGRRGFPGDDFPTPIERTRRMPDIERPRDDHDRRRREERERRDEDARREAARRHDDEANRFQKLGRWLNVSPERLQSFYQQAKAANPDLRLGQFFSALILANRLNGSNPNVTPQAILRGLDSGMSLERTLVALGLSAQEANAAAKWAQRIANHLKP